MNTPTDTLHRFLFDAAPVRGELVRLNTSWRTILAMHDYPPPLRSALGELLAAAVLLAATLKLRGSLVLQIQGQGALKLLVVECTGDLQVRATAKWEGDLAQGELPEWIGDGRFVITLDPKDGGQPYQGIVAPDGDSVAEILQDYMSRSEQLDTRLWLAADEAGAAGMLLQKLPAESGGDADLWARVGVLADTVRSEELQALPAADLLHRLFSEEDIRLFEAQEVAFGCTCSRDNVARMLQLIGRDEVDAVLAEQGSVDVNCEFCNQRYVFDAEDVVEVFAAPSETPTRH